MLNTISETIFNGLLIGSAGYAMYKINPKEFPFAFTACAVGFCHVCIGICCTYFKNSANLKKVKRISKTCLEIMPVPMANIDIYKSSQQNKNLALEHGLFIVPLAFELNNQLRDTEDDESTAVSKDLTILGNMVSMMFYAVNESNAAVGFMAFAALFATHGSTVMESYLKGTGKYCTLGGYATLFALLPSALAASKSGLLAL